MRNATAKSVLLILLFVTTCSCVRQQDTKAPQDAETKTGKGLDAASEAQRLTIAVVTGGHAFDVPRFYTLFRELPGVDAYPQHLEHFASSPESTRDAYDVVVFYGMERGGAPDDDAAPHYAGEPRAALERLLDNGQGIVILHHALLAWEKWPRWDEVIGYSERNFRYKPGLDLDIKVGEADHPITAGLQPFAIHDEGYVLHGRHDGKGEILLTVDHEDAMREVVWSRTVDNSRVVCIALGDDYHAWSNPAFRDVLGRSVAWAAAEE